MNRYMLFDTRKNDYGGFDNLEDHLRECEIYMATPDFYDGADTLEEVFEKKPEHHVVVDSKDGHKILK